MSTPEFTPGPGKPCDTINLAKLKALVDSGVKITGAKTVGMGTLKIFTDGELNYYTNHTQPVCRYLTRFQIYV